MGGLGVFGSHGKKGSPRKKHTRQKSSMRPSRTPIDGLDWGFADVAGWFFKRRGVFVLTRTLQDHDPTNLRMAIHFDELHKLKWLVDTNKSPETMSTRGSRLEFASKCSASCGTCVNMWFNPRNLQRAPSLREVENWQANLKVAKKNQNKKQGLLQNRLIFSIRVPLCDCWFIPPKTSRQNVEP